MKAMTRYFAMCAIALCGLASTSCSNDELDGSANSASQVVLDYRVGDISSETRAAFTRADDTENGADDLNENTVSRLNLFVFNSSGNLVKKVSLTDLSSAKSDESDGYTHLELKELSRSVASESGNSLYLVANLADGLDNISTLDALKAATINQASSFKCNEQQTTFVMDAKMTETKEESGTLHIKFQLKRALAKIRLKVTDANGNTTGTDKFACQLIHYAADGAVLAEGSCSDNKLNNDAASSEKITTPTCTQNSKAVFYSYANEWVDSEKDMKKEEPIDTEKQTYILLKAPYNGNNYYYKVPVNQRLPENNDSQSLTLDDYKALYRLDRNTIYDITAKIDRQGGDTPENAATLTVTPIVKDWNDGGSYDYKDAISIKANVEKTNGNGDKIAFNNATYGPKISFNNMDTNGKSWVLQTDSPDYGFIYASKVKADGSYDLKNVLTVIQGTSSNTSVEAFYVVPKSELDYTVRNNYTCRVWMIAYSPNQKVIINAPADGETESPVPGTPTEMVFTQVK